MCMIASLSLLPQRSSDHVFSLAQTSEPLFRCTQFLAKWSTVFFATEVHTYIILEIIF